MNGDVAYLLQSINALLQVAVVNGDLSVFLNHFLVLDLLQQTKEQASKYKSLREIYKTHAPQTKRGNTCCCESAVESIPVHLLISELSRAHVQSFTFQFLEELSRVHVHLPVSDIAVGCFRVLCLNAHILFFAGSALSPANILLSVHMQSPFITPHSRCTSARLNIQVHCRYTSTCAWSSTWQYIMKTAPGGFHMYTVNAHLYVYASVGCEQSFKTITKQQEWDNIGSAAISCVSK